MWNNLIKWILYSRKLFNNLILYSPKLFNNFILYSRKLFNNLILYSSKKLFKNLILYSRKLFNNLILYSRKFFNHLILYSRKLFNHLINLGNHPTAAVDGWGCLSKIGDRRSYLFVSQVGLQYTLWLSPLKVNTVVFTINRNFLKDHVKIAFCIWIEMICGIIFVSPNFSNIINEIIR